MSTPSKIQVLQRLITKAREIDAEAADDKIHEKINDAGSVGEFIESLYTPNLQTDVNVSSDGTGLDYIIEDSDSGETVQEAFIGFKDIPRHILDLVIDEVEAIKDDMSNELCRRTGQ